MANKDTSVKTIAIADIHCSYVDPEGVKQDETVTYDEYIVGGGKLMTEYVLDPSGIKIPDLSSWTHESDFTSAQIHLDSVTDQLNSHPMGELGVTTDDLLNPDFYDTSIGLR